MEERKRRLQTLDDAATGCTLAFIPTGRMYQPLSALAILAGLNAKQFTGTCECYIRPGVRGGEYLMGIGLEFAGDESGDALARVDGVRLRGKLLLALGRLPDDQRLAVAARIVDELDYAEIAAAGGASEPTVRQRVSRGLRAMQTFLEGGNS